MVISFCHGESILQTLYNYIIETQRCCTLLNQTLTPRMLFAAKRAISWDSFGVDPAVVCPFTHSFTPIQVPFTSHYRICLSGVEAKLNYHITRLERIQRRVVGLFLSVPISCLMRPLDIQPLNTRLVVADWVSLHEQVSGDIDCSAFLAKFNLRIPGPTRSTDLLVHNSNQLGPTFSLDLARVQRLGTSVEVEVDLSLSTCGLFITKSSLTTLPTPMCSTPPSNFHT